MLIGSGSVVVCTQLVVSGDVCVQLLVWWCVFIGSGSVVVCTQLVMCVCTTVNVVMCVYWKCTGQIF